jgi:hypothetical protein
MPRINQQQPLQDAFEGYPASQVHIGALKWLAVAWDQHLIAEPEGPPFISDTKRKKS